MSEEIVVEGFSSTETLRLLFIFAPSGLACGKHADYRIDVPGGC
jgi:hypothetical protein